MDREDWLYVGGGVATAAGFGWWFPPAGLIAAGVALVAWPFVARMLGAKKEKT